jgi:hypothetical protein
MAWRALWLGLALAAGCAKEPPHETKAPVAGEETERAEPFVAQILSDMQSAYRDLEHYSDEGEVVRRTDMRDHRQPPEKTLRFETHYVRPDRLHFELRIAPWPTPDHVPVRWEMWWSGGEATTWFVPAQELRTLPLDDAINAASGISAAAVHTIPSLLLDLGRPAWGIPHLEGREQVDGRECFVIDFDFGASRRPRAWKSKMVTRVWLDVGTYLIRRVRQEMSVDAAPAGLVHWVTVTSYRPNIEVKPRPEVFRPDHPDPKTDPNVHVGRVNVGCCEACDAGSCSGCRDLGTSPCVSPHILANCSGERAKRRCTRLPLSSGDETR